MVTPTFIGLHTVPSPMTKRFVCGAPDCDFDVVAEDDAEILEQVREHAREVHDRTVDEERVRERIEDVA